MATNRRQNAFLGLLAMVLVLVSVGAIISGRRPFEPRLQRLVRQLQTAEKAEDRAAAAKALGKMGAAARPAAPALVQALKDDGRYLTMGFLIPNEHYVMSDASTALHQIGGRETADAIVAAVPVVKRGDRPWTYTSHCLAMDVLTHLGPQARPVACRVLEEIDQVNNGAIVGRSLLALQAMNISPGTPEEVAAAKAVLPQFCRWSGNEGFLAASLLRRMAPGDEDVLGCYVQAVAIAQPPLPPGTVELDPRTIALLIRHLADRPNEGAIAQLGHANPAAVLAPLAEALHDSKPRVRAGSAAALALQGPAAAELAPQIMPLLTDENREVQVAAAIALWRTAKQAEAALPVLAAALDRAEPAPRDAARGFLKQLGPQDAWASPALGKAAVSGSGKTWTLELLRALERLGPAAAESLPDALKLLKDDDPEIQRAAAKAVAAIDRK